MKLIEKGLFDATSLVTATYPIDRTQEALQTVADRTTLGAVITFDRLYDCVVTCVWIHGLIRRVE